MWFYVLEYPVTWITQCAFYPHPAGNRLLTWPTLSTVEFCLLRSWVCQCQQTRKSDRSSADRAWMFNSASSDPVPLDTFQSQSRLIFPIPTLQHHLRTNESCYRRFYFLLFILFLPLTFRLRCGSYTNQFFPSISLSFFFFFQNLSLLSTWHIFQLVFIILIMAFLRSVFLPVSFLKFSMGLIIYIYLFIYCSWVVTRWQWLFYM